jgi:hypothetical protein
VSDRPDVCRQCRKPISQPRAGRPKFFCSASCRAKFSRRGAAGALEAVSTGAPPDPGREERRADLERLYAALRADVEGLGTLLEGRNGPRANPSVVLMLRAAAELGRLAAPPPEAEEVDDDDIAGALRLA